MINRLIETGTDDEYDIRDAVTHITLDVGGVAWEMARIHMRQERMAQRFGMLVEALYRSERITDADLCDLLDWQFHPVPTP